jgi:hypothetical protein
MTGWRVRAEAGSPECGHLEGLPDTVAPASECEDCVREGTKWVHLRRCLGCGHVGCCDNSPRRHATGHWRATGHPVMASAEPGEEWAWCYPDQLLLVPVPE